MELISGALRHIRGEGENALMESKSNNPYLPEVHQPSWEGKNITTGNPKFVTQPEDYYFNAYFSSWGPAGIFHRTRLKRLIGHVPPNSAVLDMGCGSGVLLYLLKKQGCSVAGVDSRLECVEFARRACGEGDFRCGDIREINMGRTFDVVVCSEVMEHCDTFSRGQILDRIRTHVRNGGLAIITFPSRLYTALEPVWRIVRKIISPGVIFDDEGIHLPLSHREVEKGLTRRGFRLIYSGLHCLGTIRCIVAQRDQEGE
jgi:SAM-dependent methyltransferase